MPYNNEDYLFLSSLSLVSFTSNPQEGAIVTLMNTQLPLFVTSLTPV